MNGVLQGMHGVGWEGVPLLAMETEGAHSFYACAQANEWVELDDITRYVVATSTLLMAFPPNSTLPSHALSVARCLGAKRVCKRSFEWLSQHPIIPHKISDREAIAACIKLAGQPCWFISALSLRALRCCSVHTAFQYRVDHSHLLR